MEGFNLKNIIPIGLILPFLIVIALEIVISYGLNFYNQKLTQEINNLESTLSRKEQELRGVLEKNEAFFVFSQVVNISEILRKKKSLLVVIDRFKQKVPKILNFSRVEYNFDSNQLSFEATVNSLQDYIRVYRYFLSRPEFNVKNFSFPNKIGDNLVGFSATLFLKPEFFKQ